MRKDNSVFKTKFISEPGSFLQNADYFAFVELQDFACYCIADGIDEDKKRKSAELAVSAVIDSFYSKSGMSKRLMKHYAAVAHKELLKESHDIRLEASILILVTNYKKIRWVNVGNARLHHIRNNKIVNKSKDQSLSQNMAEQGEIPLDKIEEHEERHNLYCYLGQPGRLVPYVSPKIKLEDGDIITLSTRGIWENTGIPELLDAVEEANEPEEVCASIEDIILSQQMRWISNYTIACIYINKIYKNPKKDKIKKRILAICIPIFTLLLISGIMLAFRTIKKENKIKQMWKQIENGIIDIDRNGKIFEETNSLKQGASSYDSFQSSGDSEKTKVKAAKAYIESYNLIQDIEQMEAEEEISYMELYLNYARLLGIAQGEDYINEKRKEQGMEGEEYKVSISENVDLSYLEEEARESFENIISKYEEKFEHIMLNARMEKIYGDTEKLYKDAIDNSSEYLKSAKKKLVYDFDNNKTLKANIADLENELARDEEKNNINKTLKRNIKTLLSDLQNFKNKIIGDAWTEKANKADEKGNYSTALDALKKAQDAYNAAGETEKASSCKDATAEIKEVQAQNKTDKEENAALKVFKQAEELLEEEEYEDAIVKYNLAKDKYENLKNDTKVSEIKESIEEIEYILDAEKYEKEGNTAKKAENYELAKSCYEYAQQYYNLANMADKNIEITKKLEKIEKKLEKKKKE